jgi:hypothetical protein
MIKGDIILLKKVSIILVCITLIFIAFSNFSVFGENSNFDVSKFEAVDKSSAGAAATSVSNMSGSVLAIVRIVAVGIGLIMLTVLGMKYLLAAPGDRAEIKGSAFRYVLGALIMFGAAEIFALIESFTRTTLTSEIN